LLIEELRSMEAQVFYDRLMAELKNALQNRNYQSLPGKAFVFWIGKNYFHIEDDDECERMISDGSNDEGIDAIFIDDQEEVIHVINASTVTDFQKTKASLPETDIKNLFAGFELITFGDYRSKVNPILEDLAKEYHQLLNTGGYKVKLLFFHLTRKPVSLKYVEEFVKKNNVEVDFIDFAKVKDIYQDYLIYRASAPEKVTVEVIGPILETTTQPRALVFTISGKTLANLFFTYGTRLFQRNVRYFLGARAKSINLQMQRTASDEKESGLFWYYNNGVTVVCNKAAVSPNRKVVSLVEMQIINGAQTTYSLSEVNQKNELKDDANVLLKVIESGDQGFIDNVTLYTNSQNPVNLRDLCSRDEIQTRIQTALLGSHKYFYERKRGEFEALYTTVEMKKKLLGKQWKDRIVNNEKAAQAYLSLFLNMPAQAKASKKRIFVKGTDGFYDKVFSENVVEEALLMAYKLLCYIEERTKQYRVQYDTADKLNEKDRRKVYKFDFLLYGDFFVLNLFRDFLEKDGHKFDATGCLEIIQLIDTSDQIIAKIYSHISTLLLRYISKRKREDETYYNAKFFKSDASLGLIREFLHTSKKLEFIRLL
jgi:hypothetical protein